MTKKLEDQNTQLEEFKKLANNIEMEEKYKIII